MGRMRADDEVQEDRVFDDSLNIQLFRSSFATRTSPHFRLVAYPYFGILIISSHNYILTWLSGAAPLLLPSRLP